MATAFDILKGELYRAVTSGRKSYVKNQDIDADSTATIQANAILNAVGGSISGYATQSWVNANFYPLNSNPKGYLDTYNASLLFQPLNAYLTDISNITAPTLGDAIVWNGTNWVAGSASSGYVPYVGAIADVDLGIYNLRANTLSWGTLPHHTGSSNVYLVGDSGTLEYRTAVEVLSDINGVPTTRTLTINGVTYDLSANRTWTISSGSVTSITLTTPTGLQVSGGSTQTITSSGTFALSVQSGYVIPTTAEETNWNTAYTNRITSATSPLSIASNVISISQATTSTSGYLSSTDWNTFNNKQGAITLTTTGTSGAATLVSNTLNIPQYQAAYTILSTLGALTNASGVLTNNGSGTLSWAAASSGTVTSVAMTVPTGLSISGSPITTSGTLALTLTSGYVIPTTTEETNWNTAYTNRITSLTTTGTSGAATLTSNTLNIPQYQAAYTILTTLGGLANVSGVLTNNGSGTLSWVASGATAISALTAATATNTINNADYTQTWSWNTLSSNIGLLLSSSSTAAASNTQALLSISLSGANATSTQTTYGQKISNTHTGTSSSNVALSLTASGGTNNYSLLISSGNMGILNSTPANTFNIGTPTTADSLADMLIGVSSTSQKGLVIQSKSGQTAPIFEVQNSGGNPLFKMGLNGSAPINTVLQLQGNTNGAASGSFYFDGTDTNNAAYAAFGCVTSGSYFGVTGYTVFSSSKNGTGTQLPMTFGGYSGSWTHWLTITTGGKVGVSTTSANSSLHINGSLAAAYIAKTANYTATATDFTIDCTSGTFTITLPTAVSITGRIYVIVNSGTGTITLATTSSQTISGSTTKTLNVQYSSYVVMSNGANWVILANN